MVRAQSTTYSATPHGCGAIFQPRLWSKVQWTLLPGVFAYSYIIFARETLALFFSRSSLYPSSRLSFLRRCCVRRELEAVHVHCKRSSGSTGEWAFIREGVEIIVVKFETVVALVRLTRAICLNVPLFMRRLFYRNDIRMDDL